jgi:sugar phosphate permease
MISAFFSNRSRGTTAGIGNTGAAVGLAELAKTMTAQMAQ